MTAAIERRAELADVLTRFADRSDDPQRAGVDEIGAICFTLGDEEFGVDLNLVRQIVKPPPLTWVPRAEPDILGVVSIRGSVVTLLDLRQVMGVEPTNWPRMARILIVELEGEPLGLLVDSVTHVRSFTAEMLEREPGLLGGSRGDFVACVARPGPDDVVTIIDLDAVIEQRFR